MAIQQRIVMPLRMTEVLRDAVGDAARASGLTMQDWIRAVLARAANEGAFTPRTGNAPVDKQGKSRPPGKPVRDRAEARNANVPTR